MQRLRSLSRCVCVVAIGALLGLGGVVALAAPASADHTEVSGSCQWDQDAGDWLVTWTVDPGTVDGATAYRLAKVTAGPAEVTASPAEAPVDGFEVTDEFIHPAGEPLVGEQRLPADAEASSLAVRVEWDNGHADESPRIGEVTMGTDCAGPDPGVELGQWSFDCSTLTITVTNPSDRDAPVTFAPSAGEPVSVELPAGESTTVQFPSGEGHSVDLLSGGQSIVDPASPIEITAKAWAEAECDAGAAGDGGEGGGLAATGTRVGLIVGGAVALLALGAALFLMARRRRIRFTA